jgi:hypothetical protein
MLNFNFSDWTPSARSALSHMSSLQCLQVNFIKDCTKTDEILRHVFQLPNLTELFLSGPTDAGFRHMSTMRNLEVLNLSEGKQITDDGLKHLVALQNLRSLCLLECGRVTDKGLKHVAALRGLGDLCLQSSKITNAGLNHLAGLKKLDSLHLFSCKSITKKGLRRLVVCLPSLSSLELTECRVEQSEVDEILYSM